MVDFYLFIGAGVGLFFLATCCWRFRKTQTVIAVANMMGQEPLSPPPVVQIHLQSQGTQQQGDDQPKGLDKATIDSYPRIVIEETGQMLQQGDDIDNTCSICLIEYQTNDTLKILPECLHRFHVDCLDEWLRINATCPVCRVHPPPLTSV